MPHLLIFTTDMEIGGTPTVVRELARRLAGDGVDVSVGCLGRFGPTAEIILGDGGDVWALDATPRQFRRAARELRRRAAGADAVLSLLVHANAVAAAARFDGPRWVQSVQTTQFRPIWHWPVQAVAARRADAVLCPSPSVAAAARRRARVPEGKLVVIPNAVDAADVADVPRIREVGGGPLRVGFLGRLDPVKRVGALIEAARLAGVELHIFGDGPERARLEQCASSSAPHAAVTFHGFTDRRRVFEEIDLLVLPSKWEGMPMVLVEAMAAGVPVVGADVPGVRDVIEDGRTGRLVADGPNFRQNLRAAIEESSSPDRRHARAAAALEIVRERYTWDRVLPRYHALLFPESA